MKSLIVNYEILSKKISDKTILSLSDLHDYPGGRKTDLIDTINNEEHDLTLISGDIIQARKYEKGSLSQKRLKDFLHAISEKTPVFLGLGNHDLYGMPEEKVLIGYKDLAEARPGMVFPLSNESKVLGDFRITEFHPKHDAFSPAIQESGNALLRFEHDYEESGLDVPNDKLFNIIMCHNPKLFYQAISIGAQLKLDLNEKQTGRLIKLSNKMKVYDMCSSGHLHGGYIFLEAVLKDPSKYLDEGYWEMPMEKDINGRITKIRPTVFKKTDMCRGTIYVGELLKRIINLCDGLFYLKNSKNDEPILLTKEEALKIIDTHNMIPVVINSGVNRFFNLPIDHPEVTKVKILKK